MSLIFGNLTQQFVEFGQVILESNSGNATATARVPEVAAQFRHAAANDASYLVYIGVGMFACTFAYMYTWVYTGEVGAKRLREAYLRAVLRQDIAFFDNVGAGEVATRIQTDTRTYFLSFLIIAGRTARFGRWFELLGRINQCRCRISNGTAAYRDWSFVFVICSIHFLFLSCVAFLTDAVCHFCRSGTTGKF